MDRMFTSAAMREIFSDQRYLQSILDFEAALARALVSAGVAPARVAPIIASKCKSSLFDVEKLAEAAALAGNVAIPLVKQLTEAVAQDDQEAMKFVHWGATSQDAIDTALVLQLRDALALIDTGLAQLSSASRRLIQLHKLTVVAGRTWLQQAPPVTLGLKVAGWLDALNRHRERLQEASSRILVLQFGGAVGTLAALGEAERGLAVSEALAAQLKLALPNLPWHTHRDRTAEAATTLGLITGSLGKIARDIALLSQSEVGEVSEPAAPGRGGSSTMPHKKNPVGSAAVLAAATRVPALVSTMLSAMVQEHERGLGGWQAEWQTLPEICMLTAGALEQLTHVLNGLEVDSKKMAQNLEITRGLIFSEAVAATLSKHLGKNAAHEALEAACRRAIVENRHLRDVLMEDAEVRKRLSAEDLTRLFDPRNYLGSAGEMIERVLKAGED
jgi:3-carboxy-cis,cis-muconate cycloisomerase